MKKRLLAGALGLAALLLAPGDAEALGLLRRHCCDHRCSLHLCIRPYNAFSPVCFGNINCMGCCPLPMGNGGMPCGPDCGPPMPSVFSGHAPGPCCSSSGCCDPGALPPAPGHPPTHMPAPGGPPGEHIGPPAGAGTPPNPLPPGANLSYYRQAPQQAPVHQAGYFNNYAWPQQGYRYPAGYGYGQGYAVPYPVGYYPQGYGYPQGYYPPTPPMGWAPNYWYGGGYGQGY